MEVEGAVGGESNTARRLLAVRVDVGSYGRLTLSEVPISNKRLLTRQLASGGLEIPNNSAVFLREANCEADRAASAYMSMFKVTSTKYIVHVHARAAAEVVAGRSTKEATAVTEGKLASGTRQRARGTAARTTLNVAVDGNTR